MGGMGEGGEICRYATCSVGSGPNNIFFLTAECYSRSDGLFSRTRCPCIFSLPCTSIVSLCAMDVGSFLRKLFGEPARGANIFFIWPEQVTYH